MQTWLERLLVAMLVFGAWPASSQEPPAPALPKDPTVVLKILNLTDATPVTEVKKLETAVRKVKDVKAIAVNKKKGEISVAHKVGADVLAIRKAVAVSGFTIVDPKPATDGGTSPPARSTAK